MGRTSHAQRFVPPYRDGMMSPRAGSPTVATAERCAALEAALDAAEEGVSVTDKGRVVYQNRVLRDLLRAETDCTALAHAIADARVAAAAQTSGGKPVTSGVQASVALTIRTTSGEYRIRSAVVTEADRGTFEVAWIGRCTPRRLTIAALRDRFGLTPREARVVSLLDAGLGSRELARVLGISVHTARRHSEAVLRKMGVHSRREVRSRLQA